MAAIQATLEALNPSLTQAATMKIENTDKRDTLTSYEQKAQQAWQESGVFETDAPDVTTNGKPQEKWFGTFAYPYMNGTLHAGHAFTVSKVEFTAGYQRMLGKKVLFPLGFHCTGMPIKACADKLVREIEMFGETFERCTIEDIQDDKAAAPAPTTDTDPTKFAAKKGKAAAKTVKAKYQFQIMLALGIPVEEIHKFADPQYWLHYFPPLAKRDLIGFGARIDWRRSFCTTDANPYYDAFVRWQMNRLKDLGKILYGKRYTVYSPKDGQPCMDHDRSAGEGVGVQEYTALKLFVKEWADPAQKLLDGKLPKGAKCYFVPATLRPETMYGQTCCFVGPSVSYGLFKISDNEYYFVSHRAARNMAFQNISSEWGNFPEVATFKGSDVIGTLVTAPLSVHKDGVRILPMESVKPTKGTGVVTCVPSDSPDDYATVMDLIKKADYYKIKKEWAELEIIPIIQTPSYGNLTAKKLVEQLKINSPKDAKPLAEAKELAYKEGFYQGTMLIGDQKGKPVQEAKPIVRQQLIDAGDAFNYAEPDGYVESRSGDECVAALMNQWFLNYGKTSDPEWYQTVYDHVSNDMETYGNETRNQFQQTLDWLEKWACARTYGLGTKLPFDPQFLVESLSDSTIYMSYYTIANQLHKGVFGKEQGTLQIAPEQMTDEVWDYVFCRTKEVPKSDISDEKLNSMRSSFQYFYPLNLRSSGKDLIQNHLTFFLYVHMAIFKKEYWPQGVRANGHLMLNGSKMSKSTGNFLTLSQMIEKFGADATRVSLADAGDGIEDANFEESVANAVILKLYELRKWCEGVAQDAHVVSSPEEYRKVREEGTIKDADLIVRTGGKGFWDELFENEMNVLVRETKQHFSDTDYKLALKSGFYDFTLARDFYREATKAAGVGMHQDLIKRYIELQALMLTPLAPHWAEYMWLEVLKKPSTIQTALWPEVSDHKPELTAAREYIRQTQSNIGSAEGAQQKKMAKGKTVSFDPRKDKAIRIFMAKQYPAWQDKYVDVVRNAFKGMTLEMKDVLPKIEKSEMKKAMPFVQGLKKRLDLGEESSKVFDRSLPFDEMKILREMVPGLKQTIQKCRVVELIVVEEGGKAGTVIKEDGSEGERREELPQSAQQAEPGSPTFHFENVEV